MLTTEDKAILEIEGQYWRYAGAKEAHVWETLGLSGVRYYQRVVGLLDSPAAEAEFPQVVRRLRRRVVSARRPGMGQEMGLPG